MTGDRNFRDQLTDRIFEMGFSCRRCTACCSPVEEDSNLVLVSAPEVRVILEATEMAWDDVCEPYPEMIEVPSGCHYTLAWALRRNEGRCIFLQDDGRCAIYEHRPWICRTYPFLLDGEELMAFTCPGIDDPCTREEAGALADELIQRQNFEEEDAMQVQKNLEKATLPSGGTVVIDSEGVTIING